MEPLPNFTEPPKNPTAELDAVKADVARLRSDADEQRNKPWYREKALLVSLASFAVAFFTAGERVYVRVEENTQKQVTALRETMVQVADLQREIFTRLADPQSSQDTFAYARFVALNTKRQLLLQNAAASLADTRVHARTSPHVFLALGYEMMGDGRYAEAERLFKSAEEAAIRDRDVLMQVWAGRTRGQLYGVRGTRLGKPDDLRNQSRALFARAAALVEDRQDDFGHKTWSETLILQAQTEIAFGDVQFGRAAALKAKERVERMFPGNPVRTNLLTVIQQLIEPGASAPAAPTKAAVQTVANATGRESAVAVEIWAPQPGSITGAEMTLVVDGRAVGKLSNLKGASQVHLGRLPHGAHTFELRDLAFFAIDAGGASSAAAPPQSCKGAFLVDERSVLRLWIRPDPNTIYCGIN